MVNKIIRQADLYFATISESVEAINDGWTFASDVVAFCDYLSSGQHTVQELESFRLSMLATASAAERRATSTIESFRNVRTELYGVSQFLVFISLPLSYDDNHLLNRSAVVFLIIWLKCKNKQGIL
jgi:hypothetical protein